MRLALFGHEGLYDPFNLPGDLFDDVENCAQALANSCRYGGNVAFHYSTAQHSVLLSESVPPRLARAALAHDMSEWVFGDLIYPMKRRWLAFDEYEEVCQRQIFAYYGIPWEHMDELRSFDRAICVDEMRVLNPRLPRANYLVAEEGLGVRIEPWTPTEAKVRFLRRFQEVMYVQ